MFLRNAEHEFLCFTWIGSTSFSYYSTFGLFFIIVLFFPLSDRKHKGLETKTTKASNSGVVIRCQEFPKSVNSKSEPLLHLVPLHSGAQM